MGRLLIWLIVVVPCAGWVGFDSSLRDWRGDKIADKPWKWVVGTLLLWIFVFPLYLVRRRRRPLLAR